MDNGSDDKSSNLWGKSSGSGDNGHHGGDGGSAQAQGGGGSDNGHDGDENNKPLGSKLNPDAAKNNPLDDPFDMTDSAKPSDLMNDEEVAESNDEPIFEWTPIRHIGDDGIERESMFRHVPHDGRLIEQVYHPHDQSVEYFDPKGLITQDEMDALSTKIDIPELDNDRTQELDDIDDRLAQDVNSDIRKESGFDRSMTQDGNQIRGADNFGMQANVRGVNDSSQYEQPTEIPQASQEAINPPINPVVSDDLPVEADMSDQSKDENIKIPTEDFGTQSDDLPVETDMSGQSKDENIKIPTEDFGMQVNRESMDMAVQYEAPVEDEPKIKEAEPVVPEPVIPEPVIPEPVVVKPVEPPIEKPVVAPVRTPLAKPKITVRRTPPVKPPASSLRNVIDAKRKLIMDALQSKPSNFSPDEIKSMRNIFLKPDGSPNSNAHTNIVDKYAPYLGQNPEDRPKGWTRNKDIDKFLLKLVAESPGQVHIGKNNLSNDMRSIHEPNGVNYDKELADYYHQCKATMMEKSLNRGVVNTKHTTHNPQTKSTTISNNVSKSAGNRSANTKTTNIGKRAIPNDIMKANAQQSTQLPKHNNITGLDNQNNNISNHASDYISASTNIPSQNIAVSNQQIETPEIQQQNLNTVYSQDQNVSHELQQSFVAAASKPEIQEDSVNKPSIKNVHTYSEEINALKNNDEVKSVINTMSKYINNVQESDKIPSGPSSQIAAPEYLQNAQLGI